MTTERPGAFDFFGPRALTGPELQPGDSAPDFALINNRFQTVTRAQFAGKPLVISVVPSLDTGVCTKQTVRFNQAAAELADRAAFVAVSADLPFAQSRWCSSNGAEHVVVLSDHREMSFGASYGTLVGDWRIESRAVFVVDGEGVVRYAEYVPSAGNEPDYEAALAALHEAL
jgi:thioredoxin-dependent peroxiredoxin